MGWTNVYMIKATGELCRGEYHEDRNKCVGIAVTSAADWTWLATVESDGLLKLRLLPHHKNYYTQSEWERGKTPWAGLTST